MMAMFASLETVKKAGPVAVIGLIAILLCQHLMSVNSEAMEQLAYANQRIDDMHTGWLAHLDHDTVSCPTKESH